MTKLKGAIIFIVTKVTAHYTGNVIFDGREDSGEALRIGIYIIFLEVINEGSGVVEQ